MGRVAMPERTGPKDLEQVLAKLKEEWRELADLLTSQSKSRDRVIEVEKILLRDTSGQYRGKISTNPDGSADLLLSDGSGNAWARLGVNQDGEAFLELKDKQGESSFKVGVGKPSPGAGAGLAATPVDAGDPVVPQPLASPGVSPRPSCPRRRMANHRGNRTPGRRRLPPVRACIRVGRSISARWIAWKN